MVATSFIVFLVALVALLAWRLQRARATIDRAEEASLKFSEDRQRLLDFMHLMTEALGEGLSRQELQQRIVHAAIVCTDALSGCFFELTDRNTMRSVAVEGLFPPHRPLDTAGKAALATRAKFVEYVLKAEEFSVNEGIVGRVARTRKGELVADALADGTIVKHDDPVLIVRSVIVVPLVFRGKFLGVLAVANTANDRPFNGEDFRLLEALAEEAGLALHNAEFLNLQIEKQQLDLDLSIASSIQQMLLPRDTLRLDGLEVNARYRAAQRVGGDLYDSFPLGASRLGVVVADVSGKGIAASLLMAICRTNLRQIAPRHRSPAAALRELNEALGPEISAGLYITILYAIVDTATNEVTFARAGHELPVIARREPATGRPQVRFVPSEGMAVGMVPTSLFVTAMADRTERFVQGDLLVLYTDGLTEAPNEDGKEFSSARLSDAVQAAIDLSPREVNDSILKSMQHFTGDTPQRDDFTLVTVRRL